MIKSISLAHFKCFDEINLGFSPITVLTGSNSGGKSSILQALLVLSQSMNAQEWGRGLVLNGNALNMGTGADVLNQRTGSRTLGLSVSGEDNAIRWVFSSRDRNDFMLPLASLSYDDQQQPVDIPLRWLVPASLAEQSPVVGLLRKLRWLSAERFGPREILPLGAPTLSGEVGSKGEFAASLVHMFEDKGVLDSVCLPDTPALLFHQVEARMAQFFPGCRLRISPVDGANAVTLQFRTDNTSQFQRPQNVGFGLTQVFPVIVALLMADVGDVILLENPEVHLHPKAQQDIGELLAQVASSGIQIVVETHSDHVLNGIRLAVRRQRIAPTDVSFHFFSPRQGEETSTFTPSSPKIDSDGRLDHWPVGFFDQFDLALSELM